MLKTTYDLGILSSKKGKYSNTDLLQSLYIRNPGRKTFSGCNILTYPALKIFQFIGYAKNSNSEKLNNPNVLCGAIGILQRQRPFWQKETRQIRYDGLELQ